MAKILVVVPTYNEAENIPRIIDAVLAQDPGIEMLIVDDGSPDGTGGIVKSRMERDPRVHLLERAKKSGLGTAYVAGFRYALERGYDLVFEMDADFSHDPKEIPNFLTAIASRDLVVGSRYTNGVRVLNWPMQRLLLSFFANKYTRLMTGLPLNDATGGFKCFRIDVLRAIDLTRITSNGYAFQIEMSYKVWKKGFRLGEVPIIFLDRSVGTSKMSREIVYEALIMLWRLWFMNFFGRL